MERLYYESMLYAMEGEDPSKAIDDEIKRNQKDVVRSNGRLPKKTNGGIPDEIRFAGVRNNMDWDERSKVVEENIKQFTRSQYERMGIQVVNEYDDLFFSVVLPEGWEIHGTGHSMWNDVTDDKGRKRISFFYKGVFYDRDAFSNFSYRYGFDISPFDDYKDPDVSYNDRKFEPWTLYITDCGKRILTLTSVTAKTDKEYLNQDDALRKEACKYLDEHYPYWKDINAYWD